jgi:hypothetical protein
MEIGPEKPDYTELWRAWVNGERSGLARVAVLGTWRRARYRGDRLFLLPTNETA